MSISVHHVHHVHKNRGSDSKNYAIVHKLTGLGEHFDVKVDITTTRVNAKRQKT